MRHRNAVATRLRPHEVAAENRAREEVEQKRRLAAIYGDAGADVAFLRSRGYIITGDSRESIQIGNKRMTLDELKEMAGRERRLANSLALDGAGEPLETPSGRRVGDVVPIPPKPEPPPTPPRPRPVSGAAREAKERVERPSIDIGERPRLEWLPLKVLEVDKRYQRDVGAAGLTHINRILREFNWSRFQPIIVSARAERYAIIDGQHRFEAAKKHPEIRELPCYVVSAPDVAAEASIFATVNTRRLGLTPHQKFWAAHASDDEVAVAVYQVATRHGVTILRGNPSGAIPPMAANSPLALQRALARYGKTALSTSLGLIAETHAEKESAFRAHLIVALAAIAAGREFGRERMKRALASLDLDQLYEDARLERITAKGTLETTTERLLRAHYDKH